MDLQRLRNSLVRAVDENEVKNLINKMIKTLNNEKNTLALNKSIL